DEVVGQRGQERIGRSHLDRGRGGVRLWRRVLGWGLDGIARVRHLTVCAAGGGHARVGRFAAGTLRAVFWGAVVAAEVVASRIGGLALAVVAAPRGPRIPCGALARLAGLAENPADDFSIKPEVVARALAADPRRDARQKARARSKTAPAGCHQSVPRLDSAEARNA